MRRPLLAQWASRSADSRLSRFTNVARLDVTVAGTSDLYWLADDGIALRKDLITSSDDNIAWQELVRAATNRPDFLTTMKIDRELRKRFGTKAPSVAGQPVRLAILSSSTTDHLYAGLRVAALRRGLWLEIYAPDYGQYLQALMEPASGLHDFKPTTILLALDDRHILGGARADLSRQEAQGLVDQAAQTLKSCWALAKQNFSCQVIQQTILSSALPLMGSNEGRLPGSLAWLGDRLNRAIYDSADEAGIDILSLDRMVADQGLQFWRDEGLWHRAKQEISPIAASLYGDYVTRLIGAQRGLSAKCIVLDLDHTLWGGVIGDDGLDGIVLGQGSAMGEAFVAFQKYLLEMTKRGVILAVCSKNDEANALLPFEQHPDMVLKRSDVSCFRANWNDKASNIRDIAATLNIGLEALVFVDDNPFERNLVRQALPMVKVPEVGDDPTFYGKTISDAGYFESVMVTQEDRDRVSQYQANEKLAGLKAAATNIEDYLTSLDMKLSWKRFDTVGLQRIVQLINKTNQFNLTTRRYTEEEVRALITDPLAITLQLRLTDAYADHGMIGVVIARKESTEASHATIDTWLMSCRVLGRQVEAATAQVLSEVAQSMGASGLIGQYIPSAKNSMVRDHYGKLGFERLADEEGSLVQSWRLDLSQITSSNPPITIIEETLG